MLSKYDLCGEIKITDLLQYVPVSHIYPTGTRFFPANDAIWEITIHEQSPICCISGRLSFNMLDFIP
jgi:hypothetical protein